MHRKTHRGCSAGHAIGLVFFLTGAALADAARPFSVVLLPDTQYYCSSPSRHGIYAAQTRWVRDRAKKDNVRFVIHLGDLVNTATNEAEWKVADAAHKILDGVVPYSVLPGNHDMFPIYTRAADLYDKYFPPSRFEGCDWYGGFMDRTNANNYCYFEGGGMRFMVVSLEFSPRPKVLDWAKEVVRAHPNHHVILATHYYMGANGGDEDGNLYCKNGYGGQGLWKHLVRKHRNIFLVVCGHKPGVYHRTRENDAGGKVHEILCDYQFRKRGGNGWLQSLRFLPARKRILVEAFSPTLKRRGTGPKERYDLEWNLEQAVTALAK